MIIERLQHGNYGTIEMSKGHLLLILEWQCSKTSLRSFFNCNNIDLEQRKYLKEWIGTQCENTQMLKPVKTDCKWQSHNNFSSGVHFQEKANLSITLGAWELWINPVFIKNNLKNNYILACILAQQFSFYMALLFCLWSIVLQVYVPN